MVVFLGLDAKNFGPWGGPYQACPIAVAGRRSVPKERNRALPTRGETALRAIGQPASARMHARQVGKTSCSRRRAKIRRDRPGPGTADARHAPRTDSAGGCPRPYTRDPGLCVFPISPRETGPRCSTDTNWPHLFSARWTSSGSRNSALLATSVARQIVGQVSTPIDTGQEPQLEGSMGRGVRFTSRTATLSRSDRGLAHFIGNLRRIGRRIRRERQD